MKDEEKAEQYLDKACGKFAVVVERNRIREAYIAGLEEGRKLGKEEQWKATEKAQKKTSARIRELEKENKELKETVSRAGYRIAELKHEIDNLKEQNKAILEDNDELNKWIDELKELHESDKKATALLMQKWESERNELKAHCRAVDEVNAKMKCCGNCKKELNKPEPLAVHVSCKKCKDYSEWELA